MGHYLYNGTVTRLCVIVYNIVRLEVVLCSQERDMDRISRGLMISQKLTFLLPSMMLLG